MKTDRKLRRYIEAYKFNSLFFRNLFLVLLLIIVPLAGTAYLVYYAYGNMQENDIRAYSEKLESDVYADFERILKEAQTELFYISVNPNVELYMYEDEIRQLNYSLYSILDLLRLPSMSRDYVSSLYLYSFKSDTILSLRGLTKYGESPEKEWVDAYLNSREDFNSLRVTVTNDWDQEGKQLSVFQDIRYGSIYSGVASMNLDMKELSKEINVPENTRVFLTDGHTILFSNDEKWIGEEFSKLPESEGMIRDGTFMTHDYNISHRTAQKYPLEVITCFGMDGYSSQLSAIRNGMILFLAVMSVLTLGLTGFISIRIFRPIESIISAIKKNQNILMGEGELFREKDELDYILHSIQRTANLKQDVDRELSERVELLKKAQAVALQSQINPHFLNNTLDTINWMAIGLLGGKNEISEMTGALSRMLRMTLENTDTIIPVGQEVEHCMYYLEIQNKRYEDKFRVIWRVPDELYSCKIIRIVLQPIVENAIYHGVKHLSNKGLITIGGWLEDDVAALTVEDNGLGMSREELSKLQDEMESNIIKESRHIGITNVNQRIKLYFGEEYGVFIESTEGVGTKVTVRFPRIDS